MSKKGFFRITALCAALFAGATFQANAAVIDFDAVSGFVTTGNSYQEDGFQLVNSNPSHNSLLFWGDLSYNADPDGNTLSHNHRSTTMTLSKIDGSAFKFNSIDLADVYNNGNGGDVQFNFLFADSSTSQSTVIVDSLIGLQTFDFNLANLIQVAWLPLTTEGPFLQLDNIVVDKTVTSAVPEPATLALLGMGLAGLGFKRRRKA